MLAEVAAIFERKKEGNTRKTKVRHRSIDLKATIHRFKKNCDKIMGTIKNHVIDTSPSPSPLNLY